MRRRNLIQPDELPYRVGIMFRDGSPLTYDSGNYPELLSGVIERIDYDGWRQRQAELRKEGRPTALASPATWRAGSGPYEGAKARLTNSGDVLVTLAAAPQGQGYETVYAQIASDAMGLDMRYIRVTTGDTGRIPFGQGTFASRITATAGPAVLQACQALRARIFTTAAIMLKIQADNFVFRGDRVCLAEDESIGVTLREVTQVANVGKHGITLLRGVPAGLETQADLRARARGLRKRGARGRHRS